VHCVKKTATVVFLHNLEKVKNLNENFSKSVVTAIRITAGDQYLLNARE